MPREAILGLSFGLGKRSPGKSNQALARVVERLYYKKALPIILQQEIASCFNFKPALVIKEHRIKGQYLDSNEVIAQAIEFMKLHKIDTVWLVAQPFLHRTQCRILIEKAGFRVRFPRTGRIPFDKDSLQWWTRGPLRALTYAILQKLTGRRGR